MIITDYKKRTRFVKRQKWIPEKGQRAIYCPPTIPIEHAIKATIVETYPALDDFSTLSPEFYPKMWNVKIQLDEKPKWFDCRVSKKLDAVVSLRYPKYIRQ